MDKKRFGRTMHVAVNVVVIVAFLLGMLNFHSAIPVIASAEQAAPQISEGDSLHLYLQNGKALEFVILSSA
jgi:cytochrome oxidase Cu insertion factor (SCO1/SenC/PrrC family)